MKVAWYSAPGASAGEGTVTVAEDMPGESPGPRDILGSTTGGVALLTTVPEVAFPGVAVHPAAALK